MLRAGGGNAHYTLAATSARGRRPRRGAKPPAIPLTGKPLPDARMLQDVAVDDELRHAT